MLKEIAAILLQKYPWNKGPTETEEDKCRYLYSCIMVAGSAEDRVFSALPAVFRKYPGTYDLSIAEVSDIAEILERHGVDYADRKAKFVQQAAMRIRSKYNGRLPDDRESLEGFDGVGRHIASVILATVFDENHFAVDYHVRRILKRLGITTKESDMKIEVLISKSIHENLWGHLSRSFVDFGQDICGMKPRCNVCPLSSFCPSKIDNGTVGLDRVIEVVNFESESEIGKFYSVTVRQGKLSCTCRGYKVRNRCKHVIAVEQGLKS